MKRLFFLFFITDKSKNGFISNFNLLSQFKIDCSTFSKEFFIKFNSYRE